MAPVNGVQPASHISDERGFSLIELLASILILAAGLMPLVAIYATAVQRMGASTPMMIAREKAREAIESVHAARDTGEASWETIKNVSAGGVFIDGPTAIKNPGGDGLINTGDDGQDELSEELFTREVDINVLFNDGSTTVINPNLREVRVVVRYKVYGFWQTYQLVTYISSYS